MGLVTGLGGIGEILRSAQNDRGAVSLQSSRRGIRTAGASVPPGELLTAPPRMTGRWRFPCNRSAGAIVSRSYRPGEFGLELGVGQQNFRPPRSDRSGMRVRRWEFRQPVSLLR